jgi:hypothetical protein
MTRCGGGAVLTDCAAAYAAVPNTATDNAAAAIVSGGLGMRNVLSIEWRHRPSSA